MFHTDRLVCSPLVLSGNLIRLSCVVNGPRGPRVSATPWPPRRVCSEIWYNQLVLFIFSRKMIHWRCTVSGESSFWVRSLHLFCFVFANVYSDLPPGKFSEFANRGGRETIAGDPFHAVQQMPIRAGRQPARRRSIPAASPPILATPRRRISWKPLSFLFAVCFRYNREDENESPRHST